MAFLDRNMEWKIEKGRIEVEIGSSSEDIRLRGSFEITEMPSSRGETAEFFAKTQIEIGKYNIKVKNIILRRK